MKRMYRTAALAALIIVASCGKDEAKTEADKIAEQAEQSEKTPLEISVVSDNVVIEGATKKNGEPPSPNGDITLDISDAGKTAFLNEGFQIPLNSDNDIVGAYLQFKSSDGTLADDYHDINIEASTNESKVIRNLKNKKAFLGHSSKNDGTTLDVDFNSEIEPGTFCYVICVYDGNGYVSAPSEVCVTVESWGGSSDVLGQWSLVKEEETEDGETEIIAVGEEDCSDSTILCSNSDELMYSECRTQEYGLLELKSDGTYLIDFKGTDENLDYEASRAQCSKVSSTETDRYQSTGNWAYVSSEDRLTLVEYSYTEEYGDETYTGTYDPGEAELIFDGTAEVNGNDFLLTIIDEDEDYSSVYKLYFSK